MKMTNDYKYFRKQIAETFEYWGNTTTEQDVSSFHYILQERLPQIESFKLYKYVSPVYHSIRNLEKQTIFLNQNGNLNDIYEGLPSTSLCTFTDSDLKILSDSAYISSFSEKNNNLLLWSHYADSHKGFCIEYDLKQIKGNKEILNHIFPVIYEQASPINEDLKDIIVNMQTLNESIRQESDEYENVELNSLPLFIFKSKVWKYEREWRVIYTKMEMLAKTNYKPIELSSQVFPFDCISGIYLGFRIRPDIKEHILEIAAKLNVPVFQASLSDKTFNIHFKKI